MRCCTTWIAAAVVALGGMGCAPISGTSSLTAMSASRPANIEIIGEPVEEEQCAHWAAIVAVWGDTASHETLTARLLERTGADMLVDAEFESSSYGVPYIYMQLCDTVRGVPARRLARRRP